MQTKVGLFDVKNVIVNMCIKYVIKRQDYLNMLFILFLNGLKLNFLIFQLQKTIRNILCDVFIGLDENYYVPGLNGSHPAILEFYFLTVSIQSRKQILNKNMIEIFFSSTVNSEILVYL